MNMFATIITGVYGSTPSGYLLLTPREESQARDEIFRSELRRCRSMLSYCKALRSYPAEHAKHMLIVGNYRRFALRRIGSGPEHRNPEVTQYGLVQ